MATETPSQKLRDGTGKVMRRQVTLRDLSIAVSIMAGLATLISLEGSYRWWAWRSEVARNTIVLYDIRLEQLEGKREEKKVEIETIREIGGKTAKLIQKRRELAKIERQIKAAIENKAEAQGILK